MIIDVGEIKITLSHLQLSDSPMKRMACPESPICSLPINVLFRHIYQPIVLKCLSVSDRDLQPIQHPLNTEKV
jgi:hypothetical protein